MVTLFLIISILFLAVYAVLNFTTHRTYKVLLILCGICIVLSIFFGLFFATTGGLGVGPIPS